MAELKGAIEAQLSFLEQLKQVLETELHLISSRDAESLITLLKGKEALLGQIESQDSLIAAQYQLATEQNELDDEVSTLFEQTKELVGQCKYRTEINEKAVEQGQLRLEHLRNLLLESRAKESMTYDKTGRTHGAKGGKDIKA